MKKLKQEFSGDSVSSVLNQIVKRYEKLKQERSFNPNDEIFDFRIKKEDNESEKHFRRRQEKLIKEFVETNLWFLKKGIKQKIKLIRKHCQIIADLFYQRKDLKTGQAIQSIIVWANRGGGKSLVAAIVIFICMVWKKMSFTDLAGSQEQALEVYSYVTEFWNCFSIIKEKLLVGDPLIASTELKNKVSLRVIANSQNAVRSKHPEGFIADEACQKERYKDDNVLQATNSVLTQEGFIIFYLSTFHRPIGLFADTWDRYSVLGFKRYRWNIYHCMKKCILEIDCKECPLTRKVEKKDNTGKVIDTKYRGCNGIARKADGWISYEQLIKIKQKAEIKGANWKVEFECLRPEIAGRVYKTKRVQESIANKILIPRTTLRSVGIDFGTSKQCAIILVILSNTGLLVPYSDFSTGTDLDYIGETLNAIKKSFGDFIVYADAEQSYGIMYLRKLGYNVEPVPFNKHKENGIKNLARYFNANRIKILNIKQNRVLFNQLINLKQDELGKVIKIEDHGPDALFCAALRFDFMYYFGTHLSKDVAFEVLRERNEKLEDSEVLTF